jgi:AbrB family looped-hinge helix DNA binding protein
MGKGTTAARRVTEATLTSKGQLTLPARVREAMGVRPGDQLRFEPTDGLGFKVTPVRRGDVLALAGAFAAAGKRVGDVSLHEMRRRVAVARAKRPERRGTR